LFIREEKMADNILGSRSIRTVAILSTGEMGHAVGQLLREHGLRVVTCLTSRSARTRTLAEKAGIINIPDFQNMVGQSDVVLSITTSEAAPKVCQQVADALRATGTEVLFAECNAIAPQTVRLLEPIITGAGGRFVDSSIIGSPPRAGHCPRFYASGPYVGEFEQMGEFGLDLRTLGPEVGLASGVKMCHAAMAKGSVALFTQVLLAAERMGLLELLLDHVRPSPMSIYQRMERYIPEAPANARRWVSETQEIEATFQHLGLSPYLFRGVVDTCRFLGGTPLGEEKPETLDETRRFQETIRQLAGYLGPNAAG
jgi:3-hydroxyisobutyrate dehydrogenase-like beta-hydroxyacid dehydrogenase